MFPWFNFRNILNVCILNTNTWIVIIKFRGHHASKFGIIYSNGSHIGFNYTHTSLIGYHWNLLTPYFYLQFWASAIDSLIFPDQIRLALVHCHFNLQIKITMCWIGWGITKDVFNRTLSNDIECQQLDRK